MSWIVLASFICGALALIHSLNASGLKFNRIRDAGKALGLFSREFNDSLRFIARTNKVWVALIGALSLLFLLMGEYGPFLAILAGFIAPIFVGSLSAVIRIALRERSTEVDSQAIQYRSRFLLGQMVTGCGLLGSTAIFYMASSEYLRRLGESAVVLDFFAMAVYGGAVLFWRAYPGRTASPTYGPATKAEAGLAAQTGEAEPETADRWRAASWDTFIFGNYTATFVMAAVIARNVCGITSHAVQMPLLIGTIGLMACLSASWLTVERHWHRLSEPQVAYYLAIGGALVLAGAALFLLGEHFRVEPLPGAFYQGKDANLLPSASVGIVAAGLMILISDFYVWQFPVERQDLTTKPAGSSTGIIRRVIVAIFMTIFPFLVALLSFFAGYHLVGGTGLSPSVGILGIAMTVVSLMSLSGLAGAFESEYRNRALRKLYHTVTLTIVGLCLFISYTVAIAELHNKNLSFDLSNPKILLGLLIGGLLPYMLVAVLAVAIVKGATSLAREIAFRYRSMQ